MASNHIWISGAMVVSSVTLVLGLYLVLPREVPAPAEPAGPEAAPLSGAAIPPASPSEHESARPSAPRSATPAAPAPASVPARPGSELRRISTEHAKAALATWQPTFVERCWEPVAEKPGPSSITVRFNLSFNPTGSLVGVGISEQRAAHRAEVAACLRGLGLKLEIPAPGKPVQVEVPVSLP